MIYLHEAFHKGLDSLTFRPLPITNHPDLLATIYL